MRGIVGEAVLLVRGDCWRGGTISEGGLLERRYY